MRIIIKLESEAAAALFETTIVFGLENHKHI